MTQDDGTLVLTPSTVAAAVQRIVAACRPTGVFAFGSRVRGEAQSDSDLDLFVLLPLPTADPSELRRRLRALLADLPFSKDILVSDVGTFARSRTQLNSVFQNIAADSLPLWQADCMDLAAIEQVCR